jgi:hypothetical protein
MVRESKQPIRGREGDRDRGRIRVPVASVRRRDKAFIRKKPAKEIITKVRRGRSTLSLVNSKTDH